MSPSKTAIKNNLSREIARRQAHVLGLGLGLGLTSRVNLRGKRFTIQKY